MTEPETPCTLRADCDHLRDCDAWDLAQEVVALARDTRCPVLLVIEPDGTTHVELAGATEREVIERLSLSLVGVYTCDACAQDVRDDILAMPRGWSDTA